MMFEKIFIEEHLKSHTKVQEIQTRMYVYLYQQLY